jgi:hypothetical protein
MIGKVCNSHHAPTPPTNRLKYPDPLTKVIEVNVLEKLTLSIDFEQSSPQQVFLGLAAKESPAETPRTLVFTCKARSCKLELVNQFSITHLHVIFDLSLDCFLRMQRPSLSLIR